MRKKQVWRYWCDFCKKAGQGGGYMAKHERGCTNNPQRTCGFCKAPSGRVGELLPIIESYVPESDDPGHLELVVLLSRAADGCPACIFAAIRQSGWHRGVYAEDCSVIRGKVEFDFKKERDSWWQAANDDREETGHRYGVY